METEAPNFNGQYPLIGVRIGPAWRDLWRSLDTVRWQNSWDLSSEVASRHGLKVQTVKGLLYQAKKAGLLESVMLVPTGRRRQSAHYRVVAEVAADERLKQAQRDGMDDSWHEEDE